ncbi:uncharacterized protein ACNS7B_015919 isoform 2-T3 [Menidia menidia]
MSRRRWSEEDGEFTLGGAREGLRSKPRFSFTELRVLLDAVKKNRYILLKKFNQGVPAEDKKRTWTDITNQVNCLGENHRQVRQIMKKWADLKCDGKRRIAAMRGPNGSSVRKKGLGPVEKMVHKILKLSPNRDVDSDSDLEGAELYKRYGRGPAPYLSLTDSPPGGAAFDISPLSSPEKDIGDQLQSSSEVDLAEDGELGLDFEENEDSTFSSLSSSLAPASSSSTTPAEPPPPPPPTPPPPLPPGLLPPSVQAPPHLLPNRPQPCFRPPSSRTLSLLLLSLLLLRPPPGHLRPPRPAWPRPPRARRIWPRWRSRAWSSSGRGGPCWARWRAPWRRWRAPPGCWWRASGRSCRRRCCCRGRRSPCSRTSPTPRWAC